MALTTVFGPAETSLERDKPVSLNMTLVATAAVFGVLFVWAYWPVLPGLVAQWWNEDEYSHGFLIPFITAWLIWTKRAEMARQLTRPAYAGLVGMGLAVAMYAAGVVGADLFLQRVSMVLMITSGVLFTMGWGMLTVLAFPLGYLLLMVPLPGIIFNSIAFPLQLLAAEMATGVLQAFSVPVFREGNVLHLAAASLDVEEACSGIRSLMSLTALALLMTYVTEKRTAGKIAVLLLIVPVTIAANVIRVAATGFVAHYVSTEAALDTFHDFAGMLVFLLAAGVLVVLSRLLRRVGIR